MERDAREELTISLLGKSQTFHNRQRVGDIMARATNDVRQLNPMMNPGVALTIEAMMGTIAPLVFSSAFYASSCSYRRYSLSLPFSLPCADMSTNSVR
jgi:hypothetical protein